MREVTTPSVANREKAREKMITQLIKFGRVVKVWTTLRTGLHLISLSRLDEKEVEKYNPDDLYVVGGESIYRMLLPYCDTVLVTKIDRAFQADRFFPNLDESPEWEMTEASEEQTCFDLEYTFTKYERRVKPE